MHTILINNIVKDTHLAGVGSQTATGARGRWPEHGAAATGERGAPVCATGRPAAAVDGGRGGDGAVGGGGAMAAGRLAAAATHGQRETDGARADPR
jgi:hypothetical protein